MHEVLKGGGLRAADIPLRLPDHFGHGLGSAHLEMTLSVDDWFS